MRIYDNGIYRDATNAEIAKHESVQNLTQSQEVSELKSELAASDYKAIKHSEGLISDEDYAPIKEYRQSLRDRINELENNQPMEE